jgi:hypothetical protein
MNVRSTLDSSLVLLIILYHIFMVSPGFSQNKPAAAASVLANRDVTAALEVRRLAIEKEFEERIRKILTGQLDTPYLLYVKLRLDEKTLQARLAQMTRPARLKTLPSSNDDPALDFVRSMGSEDLYSFVASVVISLTIDKSVSNEQEKVITTSIFEALSLRRERGDKVELARADMTSGSMKAKLENAERATATAKDQARKLETMLRDMELRQKTDQTGQRISDDLNRIANDLTATREGLVQLKAELVKSRTEAPQHTGPLAGIKQLIEGLELPITLIPVGLFLTSVLWLLSSSVAKTAVALKSGLADLGKSVQAMAETLAAASSNSSSSSQAMEVQGAQKNSSTGSENQGTMSGAEGALEMMQSDTQKTWALLVQKPYFTLSILKDWVIEAEGQLRFLQVMEAIGAEQAAEVWRRIPPEELDQLGAMLDKAVPKAQSFAAVSQLYRTVVREMALKPPILSELGSLDFFVRMTDAQLAEALLQCSEHVAGVVLLSLTPRRVVRIATVLGEAWNPGFLAAMQTAGQFKPEEFTKAIAKFQAAAETITATRGNDSILPYLVSLLDAQTSQTGSSVREFIADKPNLAMSVRGRVITFDDVLTLDQDTLYDLFGSLSPYEAAAVLSTLSAKQAALIAGFFKGKAKFQIDEELKKIASRPKLARQATIQANRTKAAVARRAKLLRDQGLIEFGTEAIHKDTPVEGGQVA